MLTRYAPDRGNDEKATRLSRKVILDGFKDYDGNPSMSSITAQMIDEWRGLSMSVTNNQSQEVKDLMFQYLASRNYRVLQLC